MMQIGIETEKEKKGDKLTKFFFKCQKVFEFGAQFQLDSKNILNLASKLKANNLNTNVS